jgi:CRISPR-associated protein Csb2
VDAQENRKRRRLVTAETQDVVVAARFPFGRYAATPWFRSRREHVGNVEWPPSPWRISRALVCAAHRLGGSDLVDAAVEVVRRLARVEPEYVLPPAREVVYAQWMPQLEFEDHFLSGQRSENGHTLLAIDPARELLVRWSGIELDEKGRRLLGSLLGAIPFLGQSVAVCELALRDAWRARARDEGVAFSRAVGAERGDLPGERAVVRLLTPEPSVTRAQLEVSTADGLVKAMPAPPGSRWVEYVRLTPPRPRRRSAEPRVVRVIHRLEGALRPPVAGPAHPEAGRPGPRGGVEIEKLVFAATGVWLADHELALADDDLDGRAERLVIRFQGPRPRHEIGGMLAPQKRLTGPAIDCALRLDSVAWEAAAGVSDPSDSGPLERLLVFRVESERPPLLADALVVTELFRRRLLGVFARRLGADAVPTKLSGKRADGNDARDDHAHLHVLVAASDEREIDRLAVWCPAGLTRSEVELVRSTTLPKLLGASVRLVPAADDRFSRPSSRFRSHTPFLPVRHPKRRGGTLRHAPADQIGEELRRRGLPEPSAIVRIDGPWSSFRIVRLAKQGAFPHLGAHGFELDFPQPVSGPIALGRNSHFGMGLFLPVNR